MSAAACAKSPALRPFLLRMARRVAQGMDLSARFSVRGLDYAAQGELERLLGVALIRKADGAVAGEFPPRWREPSAWREVIAALGVARDDAAAESVETFLTRLAWREPDTRELLDGLREIPEVVRFLRDPSRRDEWKRLFAGALGRARADDGDERTLSQLGSDWLNDSKSLRTGGLRRQLALMLSVADGRGGGADERTLFAAHGIVENPYASFVTFFAPLAFTTDAGETFDFPERLWSAGLSCTLSGETVGRIRSVAWHGGAATLVTSENAAPFARLVAARRPSLYTEGYPNHAVQRLLRLLDEAGVAAEHAGDADLDGFRIAEIVGRCIALRRVVAAEIVRQREETQALALDEAQKRRIRRFLESHPQDPYRDELAILLERGHWHEQESFPV